MEWITASLTTNNRTLAKTRDLESMSFLLTIFCQLWSLGYFLTLFFTKWGRNSSKEGESFSIFVHQKQMPRFPPRRHSRWVDKVSSPISGSLHVGLTDL